MNLAMTIKEMFQQGDIINMLCVGVIFCFIIFILSKLDRFDKATDNNARGSGQPVLTTAHNAGDNSEITAAISAAVNEYRKNK